MEAKVVYQLLPIKSEILDPSFDINPEVVKREPIDAIYDDGNFLMDPRTKSVDSDESNLTIENPSYELLLVKNELIDPLSDPLDVNPEMIKSEPIDDGQNDFLIERYILPIVTTARKDAYITENTTKKKNPKDRKVAINKTRRKGEGESRFTSYMLWSKDKRQQLLLAHPNLDFPSISKKLGQMWANVPSNEKFNWKRRAKRLTAKLKNDNVRNKSMYKTSAPSTKSVNRTASLEVVDERLKAHEDQHQSPFSEISQGTASINYESTRSAYEQSTIKEGADVEPVSSDQSYLVNKTNVRRNPSQRKKSLKRLNADLVMEKIQNSRSIPDEVKAILNGDLDEEILRRHRRKRMKIEDDDYLPTKKDRIEREKLVNGTRPRGRPRKMTEHGSNDKQTSTMMNKSPRKSLENNQNIVNHWLNRTSEDVKPFEQIKVEFESENLTGDTDKSLRLHTEIS